MSTPIEQQINGRLQAEGNVWRFHEEQLALVMETRDAPPYEVDLETCRTPSAVLDWLAQLADMGASNVMIGDFVKALHRVVRLQVLCDGYVNFTHEEIAKFFQL